MTRLRLAFVCALGVLLLTPQAAAGGGWWSYIHVNHSTVAAGQRVEVQANVAFASAAAAEDARDTGRFYVHLLRGFDDSVLERAMREPAPRNWWSLGGAEAIPVGQVTVSVSGSNLATARGAFSVPDLAPGTYDVMLCDAGCAEPLADVIPTRGFTLVADPATAQVAQRLDRVERRIRKQADRLTAVRASAARARRTVRNDRSQIEQLHTTVSSIAVEARRPPPVSPWAYAGWLLAGALAAALALLATRRRRPRPPRPARNGRRRAHDDELRELLASVGHDPEP